MTTTDSLYITLLHVNTMVRQTTPEQFETYCNDSTHPLFIQLLTVEKDIGIVRKRVIYNIKTNKLNALSCTILKQKKGNKKTG
jgi:hypothetical protein